MGSGCTEAPPLRAPPPSRPRRSANMKRLCRLGSSSHCISELCAPPRPGRASGLGLGAKELGRDAERLGCGSEPRSDRAPTARRERAPRSPALRPPGMGRAAA